MKIEPDVCPTCGLPWGSIEESLPQRTFVCRDDAGRYDFDEGRDPEVIGVSEPMENSDGKATAFCSGREEHLHFVSIVPSHLMAITWMEQHCVTVRMDRLPEDVVYPDDIVTIINNNGLPRSMSFQQITEVVDWEEVDE